MSSVWNFCCLGSDISPGEAGGGGGGGRGGTYLFGLNGYVQLNRVLFSGLRS